jgi:hypothetical protein
MPEPTEGLNVADVLRYYGATTVPEGVGWKSVKCPFHNDGVKSGSIHVERNLYNCHACPYAGSPLSLIKRKEDIGEAEAIEFARSVLGQSVENISRTVHKQQKRRPLGRERWKDILA